MTRLIDRLAPIYLLADHVGTPLTPHPHLMEPAGINVDAIADRVSCLVGILIFGIRDGQLALEDEVGCEAGMGMRAVMSVAGVAQFSSATA